MALITAGATTNALFDTDLQTFLMDRWDGSSSKATDNSWEITLAELINWGGISNMGMASNYTLPMAIKRNIKANAIPAVGAVIGAQVVNSLLKKSGLYRMLNKTARMVPAVGKMVKF